MTDAWQADLVARLDAAHHQSTAQERGDAYTEVVRFVFESRRIVVITSVDLASLRSAGDIIDLLKDKVLDLVVRQANLP